MSHGNLQKYRNPNPLQRYLIRRFFWRIAGVVVRLKPHRVLDAGCGEGFVLRRLPPNAAVGVDLSYTALKLASTWSHSVQQADVTRLPFADHSFDLVICLEVLEHLPDSAVGLRELLRVSRGHVLTSVPHEPYFRLVNLARGKHVAALGNDPEHLQNFTGPAFRRLVTDQAKLIYHGFSFPWQIALMEV